MDITVKNVLNFEEVVQYTGMKASYLYKLTSTGRIPHYKPTGKMIFFRREELEEFLTRKADKKQSKAK
jgi:excisionase family DNA binding protein